MCFYKRMISILRELEMNNVFMLKNKHNHDDILYIEQKKLLIFNKR